MYDTLEAMAGWRYTVVGIVIVVAVLVLVWMMVSIRRRRQAQCDDARRIDEGIDRGELIQDPVTGIVYATCIICRSKATCYAPRSGISWMDQLPLLNRLYCLSPRYIIEDDEENHLQYCKPHYTMAVKKLEQFHSELRAQSAKFVADQADKVSHMDAGGLRHIVRTQYMKMDELLKESEEAIKTPRLPEGTSQNGLPSPPTSRSVLSVVSSEGDEREEIQSEVMNG